MPVCVQPVNSSGNPINTLGGAAAELKKTTNKRTGPQGSDPLFELVANRPVLHRGDKRGEIR
jgi:hypothetical protein